MNCLRPTKTPSDGGLETAVTSKQVNCVFCEVSPEKGFKVIWEDSSFIAFKDHKPAAQHHIQVIPRNHIRSIKSLTKSDVELVKSMEDIGHKILDGLSTPRSMHRMGFHIPPFNSINHLHLHVQALPYTSLNRSAKYLVAKGNGSRQKGFSWFVEVGQVIGILEQGNRVTVFPC